MSKVYYDHLIVLDDIEKKIKKIAQTQEEREELWQLVDDIIHHRVLACVLDNLPKDNHKEFLGMFHEAPHSLSLMDYLKERIKENVEELIKQEIGGLASELLEDLQERE